MNSKTFLKITLLLTSMMTMMAGAVVAPSLPQIKQVFIKVENVEILTRLVITLPALFIAFFSPIIGRVSDRVGRKNILLFSLLLYGISGTSGFFLSNIYYILIGRAFLGIAVGGIMTLVTALIGDYFSGTERTGFAGIQGAFMGVGGIVFITMAGIFADIDWQMPFLIYLFSIPVLFLGIVYLYEPEKSEKSPDKNSSDNKYDKKLAFSIYILAFFGIVFFYMVPVQIPFLLSQIEGVSNAKIGYAISVSTLSGSLIAMKYNFLRKYLNYRQIFQIAMLMLGMGYLVISMSESYLSIISGLFIGGFGTGLLMPTGNLWILAIAPEGIRGTLIGRNSTAIFMGMFLSPIIIQPVINTLSVPGSFLVASISMIIISILLFTMKSSY